MATESIVTKIKKAGDYLPIIAVVPLALGGLWQTMELASMSSSYIRFFSVSQQLADGLLILSLLTVIYFAIFFVKSFLVDDFIQSVENVKNMQAGRIIFSIVLNLVSLVATAFFLYPVYNLFIQVSKDVLNSNINLPQIIFVLAAIVLFAATIKSLLQIALGVLKKYINFELTISSNAQNIMIFCSLLLFIVYFFPIFHSAYVVPKDLTNIDYVLKKYAKESSIKNVKNLQIAYMNDKYIFIRDSTKIEVVKIDYMFKEDK